MASHQPVTGVARETGHHERGRTAGGVETNIDTDASQRLISPISIPNRFDDDEPKWQPALGHLPAKHLSKKTRSHLIKQQSVPALVAIIWATGTCVYAVVMFVFLSGPGRVVSSYMCDEERTFAIDLKLGGNLSLAQVKLIEFAWNLVVGQGGRLFHGWILCKYVAADALVRMMELSAVPYSYYIELSFSTISSFGIWELCKMVARRPRWRVVVVSLWLLYAISYTILFPAFWSLATAYHSPRYKVYEMPDGTLSELETADLSLCWSIDAERLSWENDIVEIGPNFMEIEMATHVLSSGIKTTQIFDSIAQQQDFTQHKDSQGFLNIYSYAKSSQDLLFYLNWTGASTQFYDTELIWIPLPNTYNMSDDATYKNTADTLKPITSNSHKPMSPPSGLPKEISGWQYYGDGQRDKGLNPLHPDQDSRPTVAYYTTFKLTDLEISGKGIIPYNSTFWYGNKSHNLEPPFLNVGKGCQNHSGFFSALGNCVCYRGIPISYDWQAPSRTRCLSSVGYSWGFSNMLVLIGLCLELLWIVGCWAVWLDANIHSKLLQWQRCGCGVTRSTLDLADCLRRELGESTGAYSNVELDTELRKRGPIRYSVSDYSNGKPPNMGLALEECNAELGRSGR